MPSLAGKPDSWLLFYDKAMSGKGVVTSAFSQKGAKAGPVVVDSGNRGSMTPECLDANGADADARPFEARVTYAGGTSTSGWGYGEYTIRPVDPVLDDEEPRGQDESRLGRGSLCMYTDAEGVSGHALVYSRVHHRMLTIGVRDNGASPRDLLIRYWDVDDHMPVTPDDTTSISMSPEREPDGNGYAIAACELQDGSLLMVVRTTAITGNPTDLTESGDLDVYKSMDGGLTWQLVVSDIIRRFSGFSVSTVPGKHISLRVAASGPWIRICYGDYDPSVADRINTLTSNDGGVTWALMDQSINLGSEDPLRAEDTIDYDIAGGDDASGTFVLAYRSSTTSTQVEIYHSSRDDSWQASTVSITSTHAFHTVVLTRTDRHILGSVWEYDTVTAETGQRWFRIPLNRILESSAIEDAGSSTRWISSHRYVPGRACTAWTGSAMAILFCPFGAYAAGSRQVYLGNVFYGEWGGWSTRPVKTDWEETLARVSEALHWQPWQGRPAGGGATETSPITIWTEDSNAGAVSWNPCLMSVETSSNGERQNYERQITGIDGQAPEWSGHETENARRLAYWLADWTMRYNGPTKGSEQIDFSHMTHGVRVFYNRIGDSTYWQLEVRIGATSAVVWDSVADAEVTRIDLDFGSFNSEEWWRFLLGVSPALTSDSIVTVSLQVSRASDPMRWQESEVGTVSSGINPTIPSRTDAYFSFGAFGHGNHGEQLLESEWRRVAVYGQHLRVDYGQHPTPSPSNLPGAVFSNRPMYVERGLSLRWGGAGGHLGDSYTVSPDYECGVANLFVDSPSVKWRSEPGVSQGWLVFDASLHSPASRFNVSDVFIFGAEQRQATVEFSQDGLAWPVSITCGNDTTGGVAIDAVNGRILEIDETNLDVPPGSLGGQFMTITTGVAANNVYRVARHITQAGTHYLTLDEGAHLLTQITAGDTAILWMTTQHGSHSSAHTAQYMRIRPEGEPFNGEYAIGTIVVGLSVPIRVPLDWVHSDERQHNNQAYRTRSGMTWGYRHGPTQRQWYGRMIGDTSSHRQEISNLIEDYLDWSVRPFVFVSDSSARAGLSGVYDARLVRWNGNIMENNQFIAPSPYADDWRMYRRGGDLQLSFIEVV